MNKDNWRTPPELVDDSLALLGAKMFDTDLCCTDHTVAIPKSLSCITLKTDSLKVQWGKQCYGRHVFNNDMRANTNYPLFCNPPFSKKWRFLDKAKQQVSEYNISCLMVLPYAPATKEWRDNVDSINGFVFVPDGRYQFLTESGELPKRLNKKTGKMEKTSPDFPVALVYVVPFFTAGAKYINYSRGIGSNDK